MRVLRISSIPQSPVDPDGNIDISFYDTRLSSTSTAADVFVARSSNGNRFDNLRISSVASNDSLTNPSRDYTGNLGSRTAIAISQGRHGGLRGRTHVRAVKISS